MLLKGRMMVDDWLLDTMFVAVFLHCKLRIHVCNTNLEFILQVTIKLISLLNLVIFMEYVIVCRNLNEICDCL
jgi:hypothetical protein